MPRRCKIKEVNDKRNDRLAGRCRIDRRPEGRENLNQNFGRNDQNLLLEKLWGTSQDRGGGGVGGVKGWHKLRLQSTELQTNNDINYPNIIELALSLSDTYYFYLQPSNILSQRATQYP